MNKELEEVQSESQTFLSYERRAESLANEIKNLQGELGDYNTVCIVIALFLIIFHIHSYSLMYLL